MRAGPRVGVVGLGAIGSMTLWSLARSGIATTGFERHEPGHDNAAYGGYTRQFRLGTHDRHDAAHLPLARRSLELWHELEASSGDQLYLPTGQLGVGPATDPDIATLRANLDANGLAHRVLTPDEVMDAFPAHRVAEDEVGVLVEDAGVLRSNRGVAAAVRAAAGHGAEIVAGVAVTAIEPGPGSEVTVTAAGKSHRFDHVVVTTGPWIGELVPKLHSQVTARAIVTGWHTAPPQLGNPAMFPPGFRRAAAADSGFTFLPALDGRGVKVIHWMPLRPEIADTSTWDHRIDPEIVRAVAPAVTTMLAGIAPVPSETQVYLEGFTSDRFPLIGSPVDGLTVLCGYSGMGFAVAPAFGEIASDLAVGATPNFDLSTFEDSRCATASRPGCA